MRVTFLFWNIKSLPLQVRVAQLAVENGIDIVMLAECAIPPQEVLAALASAGRSDFTFPFPGGENDIAVFVRFAESVLEPVYDDPNGHVTIRRLLLPDRPAVLLAIAHVQSKVNWTDADQDDAAQRLSRQIRSSEEAAHHRRTILVGDFNMNPFQRGMAGAMGLHGVMSRALAEGGSRIVDAHDYPYFYNPMWSLFGDRTYGPAGTHYYRAARPLEYFWHMFDQVLVRPDLMHALRELTIIDRVAGTPLLKNGRPDQEVGSDHLPLFFSIDL